MVNPITQLASPVVGQTGKRHFRRTPCEFPQSPPHIFTVNFVLVIQKVVLRHDRAENFVLGINLVKHVIDRLAHLNAHHVRHSEVAATDEIAGHPREDRRSG